MRHWDRLRAWLPAIVWAALISGLSTDAFSAQNTSRVIVPILRWLFSRASVETIELMHELIRKTAHLGEYFIFSILLTRGLRGRNRGWKVRWAVWAVILAAGYAALDEFHQSFVPSRGASPWDSLLDTAGAAAAQIALWTWTIWRARSAASAGKQGVTPSQD